MRAGASSPNRLRLDRLSSTVAASASRVTGRRQSLSSRGGASAAPYTRHAPNVSPCTAAKVSTSDVRSAGPTGRNTKVHAAPASVATVGANQRVVTMRRPAHTLVTHSTSSAAAT